MDHPTSCLESIKPGENKMLGKLLGKTIKIINTPARALENVLGAEDDEDRPLSGPLNKLAEELEKGLNQSS